MNDLIPDKQAYQLNKRRMAWTALGMMIVSTIAVLVDPAILAEPDDVHVRFSRADLLRTECLTNLLGLGLAWSLRLQRQLHNRSHRSKRVNLRWLWLLHVGCSSCRSSNHNANH